MIEFKKSKLVPSIDIALKKLEGFTKKLKVMRVGANSSKRKVVLSSKLLSVVGMSEGSKVVVEPLEQKGFMVRPATIGDCKTRKISSRTYSNRKGVEPVFDMRNQSLIDETLGDASHVHVIFKQGLIEFKPIHSHSDRASQSNTAASISLGEKNSQGIYSSILEAIELIKQRAFCSIDISADDSDFTDSQECTLFQLQLRRLGYEISHVAGGLTAELPASQKPKSKELYKLSHSKAVNLSYQQRVLNRFNHASPQTAFSICSSGVDISALEADGFRNLYTLDYRPPEKRDFKKTFCKDTGESITTFNDKTDTGALCAAINSKHTKLVFNEDIYEFNFDSVSNLINENPNLLQISIQCDDFSCLKTHSARKKSIEDLSSTRDMFLSVLDTIKKVGSPCLLIENVKPFYNSVEAQLFRKALEQVGYKVYEKVLSAKDYNGMSNRERYFMFATMLPVGFTFPSPVARTANAWRDVISKNLQTFRDVSHTSSVRKGIETGRIRTVSDGDAIAPAITKSQNRQAKDSLYVSHEGRYLMPDNKTLMELMGFVEGFDLSAFTVELGAEMIGQSVEVPMHRAISGEIAKHIKKHQLKLNSAMSEIKSEIGSFNAQLRRGLLFS